MGNLFLLYICVRERESVRVCRGRCPASSPKSHSRPCPSAVGSGRLRRPAVAALPSCRPAAGLASGPAPRGRAGRRPARGSRRQLLRWLFGTRCGMETDEQDCVADWWDMVVRNLR